MRLNATELIATLIERIEQLTRENEKLKAEIAKLKGE